MTEETIEEDCTMRLEIAPPADEDASIVAEDEGTTPDDTAEADVAPNIDEGTTEVEVPKAEEEIEATRDRDAISPELDTSIDPAKDDADETGAMSIVEADWPIVVGKELPTAALDEIPPEHTESDPM